MTTGQIHEHTAGHERPRTADSASEAVLSLSGCRATFEVSGQQPYTAVRGIDIELRRGTFTSIVGPTGCGKSTILNMAAGLLTPSEGTVSVKGEALSGINSSAGYLFQQDALLPWERAIDNVALALKYRRVPRQEARRQAVLWLERVGLGMFTERYPAQLSGGQRRRVSMAQMWITNPELILMDEPFSALDVQTRLVMEDELLRLWSQSGASALFVTHDLDEAVGLSDEIVVLSAGPGSSVAGRFHVDIARPRNLLDIKQLPEYQRIYDEVWDCLKTEVMKAHHVRR